jgi:hypothetical protein
VGLSVQLRQYLLQNLDTLSVKFRGHSVCACNIAARMSKALVKTSLNSIVTSEDDDGICGCRLLKGEPSFAVRCHDHVRPQAHEVGGDLRQPLRMSSKSPPFHLEIFFFGISKFFELVGESGAEVVPSAEIAEVSNDIDFIRPPQSGRKRCGDCPASKSAYELASLHAAPVSECGSVAV